MRWLMVSLAALVVVAGCGVEHRAVHYDSTMEISDGAPIRSESEAREFVRKVVDRDCHHDPVRVGCHADGDGWACDSLRRDGSHGHFHVVRGKRMAEIDCG
jgi:hypothetical protein